MDRVRAGVFWAADALSGATVKKAMGDLQRAESLDYNSDGLRRLQRERIDAIVRHAVTTVPFYRDHDRQSWPEFPVVNKSLIQDARDAFLAAPYLDRKVVTMRTSGSTGSPFAVVQDLAKKKRVWAEVLFYGHLAGYDFGSRLIYLRALTASMRKSPLRLWLQNEVLADASQLSDADIERLLRLIESGPPGRTSLLAYASTLDVLADYFRRHPERRNVTLATVMSQSEMLGNASRTEIMGAFNCGCFSRYSNQENGILGQDSSEAPNVFLLNEAHYLVEVLQLEGDEPAAQGEPGRIVVTDFFNRAMPLIRYDTGDVGIVREIETPAGIWRRAIVELRGRRVDLIQGTAGSTVSPHVVTNIMWDFPGVRQFQFAQTGPTKYRMRIVADAGLPDQQRLAGELRRILGHEAELEIDQVESIPLAPSGKRRYIVNEYRNPAL